MRYGTADNLLTLALELQAHRQGLSLDDIEERFGVGRRTAQRMRDAILRIFPQTVETEGGNGQKRWHIPSGLLDRLIGFTAEELAALEAAGDILRRDNLGDQAETLDGLGAKLRALMRPDLARRVAPDLEALLEAEGLAMRPGPRSKISRDLLQALRDAVKGCREVHLRYRARSTGREGVRIVQPYGFLYGQRHYLVGRTLPPDAGFRLYSLPNIAEVEVTDRGFVRDPGFDLTKFAEQAFGVFQEQPVDVVWRFKPDAAADARDFLFHPQQVFEPQSDGAVIVRFRAGGLLEMAWHLYLWGDQVEVLAPAELAAMVAGHQRQWPARP